MGIKSEVKKVIKHSSIYGIGNILHRIPPLVLLPLYLHYLTPDDYGKKEIVSLIIDFMGIMLSMGIANALGRFYYDFSEEGDRNLVVSTIMISFAVISLPIIIAIGWFAEPIAELAIDSREDKYLILMALASLWLNSLYRMACDYLRVKEKSFTYIFISTAKLILQLSLNVIFIAVLGWGVYGIFASTLASAVIFTVALVTPLLIRIGPNYSHALFKRILAFGAPMVISQLMSSIVHVSDRYFVKAYVSLASAGIYTLGYRLGNSIHYFVQSPFQQIWNPRRFAIHKNEDAKDIYARMLTYYSIVQGLVAVLLIVCVRDILLIIGKPGYLSAADIAPIICVAYVLFGIQNHLGIGILIMKKTGVLAKINSANAALNLSLNFLLIPEYGMYGAAWATLACMIFRTGVTWYYSNRIYRIGWEYGRSLWILFSGALACSLCFFISYSAQLQSYLQNYEVNREAIKLLGIKYLFIHGATGLLVYLSCLFIPGFFTKSEIDVIKTRVQGLLVAMRLKASRSSGN